MVYRNMHIKYSLLAWPATKQKAILFSGLVEYL